MPPKCFESEVESFLEGSHGDRTHIKRADHHTVTPLCGTLLVAGAVVFFLTVLDPAKLIGYDRPMLISGSVFMRPLTSR